MSHTVTVKFVAKGNTASDWTVWARQLPGTDKIWKSCRFIFDPEARDYDWLVVYDDLPPAAGERFSLRTEHLACPASNTLFITAEPSRIKTYGRDFLNQFGVVISSQEEWTAPQGKTLHTIPGLRWYHGVPMDWRQKPETLTTYDQMLAHPPLEKTKLISTLCSSKNMAHTLHGQRIALTSLFEQHIRGIEIFGHGRRFINDKKDALDPFRYHIAIENHLCRHHVTEKLTDGFLGLCLPFYFGCPNAADYFPAESFIALDMNRQEEAVAVIKQAIADNEWEKRLPAIREARRRVMEEHNLFAIIERVVSSRATTGNAGGTVLSRRLMQRKNPLHAVRFAAERLRARFG